MDKWISLTELSGSYWRRPRLYLLSKARTKVRSSSAWKKPADSFSGGCWWPLCRCFLLSSKPPSFLKSCHCYHIAPLPIPQKPYRRKECTTWPCLEQTNKLDVANSQYKVLLLPGILPKLEHAFGPQQATAKEFQNDDDTIEVFPWYSTSNEVLKSKQLLH